MTQSQMIIDTAQRRLDVKPLDETNELDDDKDCIIVLNTGMCENF